MNPPGPICTQLNPFGCIWTTWDPFGPIWTYLDQFGTIWTHLDPFGPVWSYLELFGPIWRYLKLFGGVYSCLYTNFKPWCRPANIKIILNFITIVEALYGGPAGTPPPWMPSWSEQCRTPFSPRPSHLLSSWRKLAGFRSTPCNQIFDFACQGTGCVTAAFQGLLCTVSSSKWWVVFGILECFYFRVYFCPAVFLLLRLCANFITVCSPFTLNKICLVFFGYL